MKTTLTLIALFTVLISARADDGYKVDQKLNNDIDGLSAEWIGAIWNLEPFHTHLHALMDRIGMREQSSDNADMQLLFDYKNKQMENEHNWVCWQEFEWFESHGCCFAGDPYLPRPIQAVLLLQDVTNWTGIQSNGLELGYVVTNYVAVIAYEGQTNTLTIKTAVSEIAKWREPQQQLQPAINMTNYWLPCSITNFANVIQELTPH